MTTTTSTTLEGVSVLSKQQGRNRDRFDVALSRRGVEVHRPGRPTQLLSWDRVSQWEIEEGQGYVVLTLRGAGAATPLVVPGWSLDDLEVLMRDVTSDPGDYHPDGAGLLVDDPVDRPVAGPGIESGGRPENGATAAPPAPAPAPAPTTSPRPAARKATKATPLERGAPTAVAAPAADTRPRAERRRLRQTKQPAWQAWKPVVTVVLLGGLAAAVTLVLLQSAGIINWGFLGPIA
ncbi:MAG TPA: hypothetical protein VHS57_04410 [Acidimicrobiales bacterium]|nr:hypothetical protein [Acidimicrobiales bacterium]